MDDPDGIVLDTTSALTPEQKQQEEVRKYREKREKDASAEGELDFSNPDATPNKYSIFSEEQENKTNELVMEFFTTLIKTDIPFAFIESIPDVIRRRLQVFKARGKVFEVADRYHHKAHLTPMNQIELYETVAESQEPIDDMDD